MGFSLLILFLCDKNSYTVLNTAFEIFSVVAKNRCHLRHRTSQKTQKYLYNGKNIKKNFLQLRCSNVVLHLKYKVLSCELKIKFKEVAGGKALATDHRGSRLIFQQSYLTWSHYSLIFNEMGAEKPRIRILRNTLCKQLMIGSRRCTILPSCICERCNNFRTAALFFDTET